MTTYDLEKTYLFVDGAGGVTATPGGPEFWRTIGQNPAAGGTLVTVGTGEGDWPHWEIHPVGDEVLVLLEGSLRMLFEHPDGRTSEHPLAPGGTLIVPTGVWHRAIQQNGVRMLFITYGEGTQHKPVRA
jgi:mannose-6-phosphate isomerase-like protein (cupin superfamily)